MSLQTYAPEDNLPVPVTSGTTIQAWTAVDGEVWVAKAGVYSGNWRKAREVLHACVGRSAAFTPSTTLSTFGWDATIWDTYGMFVGNPTYGFVVPVGGWYHLNFQWDGTIGTLAEYSGTGIWGGPNSANQLTNENCIENVASGGMFFKSVINNFAAAGDIFSTKFMQSTVGTGVAGLMQNRFFISYLGSA